ncbi:MAG: hypothetical protein WCP15_02510 [bacterium]
MKKKNILAVFGKIALALFTIVLVWKVINKNYNRWINSGPTPTVQSSPAVVKTWIVDEIILPADGSWSRKHYKPYDCEMGFQPGSTPVIDVEIRANSDDKRIYRESATPDHNAFNLSSIGDGVSWIEVRISKGEKVPSGKKTFVRVTEKEKVPNR